MDDQNGNDQGHTALAALLGLLAGAVLVSWWVPELREAVREATRRRRRYRLPFHPPDREVFVANLGSSSVLGFAMNEDGWLEPEPRRVLEGPDTGLVHPVAIALNRDRTIHVVNMGDPEAGRPWVTIHAPDARGDDPPIRTITTVPPFGGAPSQSFVAPTGITIRRTPRNIMIADADAMGLNARILEFGIDHGNLTTGSISGHQTRLRAVGSIAVDEQNRVFVADPLSDAVFGFTAQGGQHVNVAPSHALQGSATLLRNPLALAFTSGPAPRLYVLNNPRIPNQFHASINIYDANATGDVSPLRRIGGPFAGQARLYDPLALAVDRHSRVFVADGNAIKIYRANAAIDQRPDEVFTHARLNAPTGIAIHD